MTGIAACMRLLMNEKLVTTKQGWDVVQYYFDMRMQFTKYHSSQIPRASSVVVAKRLHGGDSGPLSRVADKGWGVYTLL